jgi:acetyl esterase/lipase
MLALDERYLRVQGMTTCDIAGTIALAGPHDFLPLTAADLKDIFAPAGNLAQTRPIHFVGGHEPPLLLMAGASDEKVRPANSINLAHRMRTAGGRAQLIVFPDRGHAGILLALAQPLEGLDRVLRDTVDFIRKHAAACHAQPR